MTFKNLAAILLLFCFGSANALAAPDTQPATQPAEPEILHLPSFGFSVRPPEGWIRNGEDDPHTAAQWTKLDSTGLKAAGILRIEISVAKNASTLAEFAREEATIYRGKVADQSVAVGGQPSLQFSGNPPPDKTRIYLVAALVTEHAGCYYTLFYYAPADGSASPDVLSTLASGLQWCDLVSPDDAIAPRNVRWPDLILLPGSTMMFSLPDPFRFAGDNGKEVQYATYDFHADQPGATLTIAASDAKGTTLASIEDETSRKSSQLGLTGPFTWKQITPSVALSDPVARTPSPDGTPRGPMQLIFALDPAGQCIRLLFNYPPEKSPDKYAAAAQDIARGIVKTP